MRRAVGTSGFVVEASETLNLLVYTLALGVLRHGM